MCAAAFALPAGTFATTRASAQSVDAAEAVDAAKAVDAARSGAVRIAPAPRDADFGVVTRDAALRRRVEMYQWTRRGDRYVQAWSAVLVDTRGFAPGHDNPAALPLRSREWRARVAVDGVPLSPEQLDALGTWRALRPNFSALPANMAATLQPEGDGLGSADNPLAPAIGDLRIRWESLALAPLDGRLQRQGDGWRVLPRATDTVAPAFADAPARSASRGPWAWIVACAALASLLLLFARRRRR